MLSDDAEALNSRRIDIARAEREALQAAYRARAENERGLQERAEKRRAEAAASFGYGLSSADQKKVSHQHCT